MGRFVGRCSAVVGIAAVLVVSGVTPSLASEGYSTDRVAGQSTGGGALPFTGADLLGYLLVGCGILICGLVARRLAKPRQPSQRG